MTHLKLDIPKKNSFLTQREKHIRSLYYYGEFLALLDFDDGWDSRVHPLLMKYISEVSESIALSGIEVSCNEIQNQIRIILSASEVSDESIEKVFEISRDLQRNYDLSPIIQHVDKSFVSPKNMLPVECEKPGEGTLLHPRSVIQREVVKLQELVYDKESTQHRLDLLQDIKKGNPSMRTLFDAQEKTLHNTEAAIQKLSSQIPETIAMQYLLLSQIQSNSKAKVIVKKESDVQETENSTPNTNNEIIQRLEKIENASKNP